jgi:hypothetical protein
VACSAPSLRWRTGGSVLVQSSCLANGMGCGGWRKQSDLRLQPPGDMIISRFILPLSSFAPQNGDPLYYTLDTGQACRWGKLVGLGFRKGLRVATRTCRLFLGLFRWSVHHSRFCIGISTSHLMILFRVPIRFDFREIVSLATYGRIAVRQQ